MSRYSMPTALVVTTIHPPNDAMRSLADGCVRENWQFIVAGDRKSPPGFSLDGARFLSLADQAGTGFSLAEAAPVGSYTRKNIGYLVAIRDGAKVIVETDDDNHPLAGFWLPRNVRASCRPVGVDAWVNAYRYFTSEFIYPRGLPLCHARCAVPQAGDFEALDCPVQQGLADNDPDVDAVYRMLFQLPFRFDPVADPVLLRGGSWCPFNSQNTTFFESAFPLLYLPARCSFRMTDIWRGFVAQRVLHAQGLGVLYHSPTVWQERNDHDLQRNFIDEIPGYSHNDRMRDALVGIPLSPAESTRSMMERCYEVMIRNGWVGQEEEALLQLWFDDLESLVHPR